MNKEEKAKIIKEYAINDGDVGSADVQIAVLTAKILELTEHLKIHRKDKHSTRGLVAMVNRRRKLLNYLEKTEHDRYVGIVEKLKLRR